MPDSIRWFVHLVRRALKDPELQAICQEGEVVFVLPMAHADREERLLDLQGRLVAWRDRHRPREKLADSPDPRVRGLWLRVRKELLRHYKNRAHATSS